MAAGEDGEHTRFPCLAMVRYAVATVVTVLAAAVVVMAIHAVLRSEDVHLSIDYGYIQADGLWSVTEANGADELPVVTVQQSNYSPQEADVGAGSSEGAAAIGNRAAVVAPTPTSSNRSGSTHTSSSSDSTTTVEKIPEIDVQVQPYLNLRFILSAHNPGGRSKIDCNKTTIRLLDMRNVSQEIVQFELNNFTVPQQTAHTQTKRVEVSNTNNKTVLDYIVKHYHGATRFRVMVQVDAIITSYPLEKANSNKKTYFCSPVTVGLITYGTLPGTDVACKTREETQLSVGAGSEAS